MTYLYLDIETIPADMTDEERDELVATKRPASKLSQRKGRKKDKSDRETDSDFEQRLESERDQWDRENVADVVQRTALDSMHGRLWMIGWALNDGPVRVIRSDACDEAAMLDQFDAILPDRRPQWVCHRGLGFDLPWLWRRAVKYGLTDLVRDIPHDQWGKDVDDTAKMWAATDFRSYHSLDKIARYLGVPPKMEGVSGAESGKFWREGRGDEFEAYCAQDVETLRAVHKAMRGVR